MIGKLWAWLSGWFQGPKKPVPPEPDTWAKSLLMEEQLASEFIALLAPRRGTGLQSPPFIIKPPKPQ